jgi:hypothetical protein
MERGHVRGCCSATVGRGVVSVDDLDDQHEQTLGYLAANPTCMRCDRVVRLVNAGGLCENCEDWHWAIASEKMRAQTRWGRWPW